MVRSSESFQPPRNISGSTTALNAQSGGRSLRILPLITLSVGLFSERAISDPASANITPIDGNSTVNHAQPNRW